MRFSRSHSTNNSTPGWRCLQVTALSLLIGTLEQCKRISSENREALVHKCAGYSSRLLKKPDQCRAAYACR